MVMAFLYMAAEVGIECVFDKQAGTMMNLCGNYEILSEGVDDRCARLSQVAKTMRSLRRFHCDEDGITIER